MADHPLTDRERLTLAASMLRMARTLLVDALAFVPPDYLDCLPDAVAGVLAIHDAEQDRLRAVVGDTPFVDEMRRLSAERHAAALAAPVGTFTTLCGPVFGLGE